MYCPKCATQNMENARFCRGCGADLSLVSQALTGQLPQQNSSVDIVVGRRDRRNRDEKPPRLDKGIEKFISGMAFILVAFACRYYAPAGQIWWFWMLIPAFTMIGGGIAEMVRWKLASDQQAANKPVNQPLMQPPVIQPPVVGGLPPRNTSEIYTPPSVTESTTRHLDPAAAQRYKDQS